MYIVECLNRVSRRFVRTHRVGDYAAALELARFGPGRVLQGGRVLADYST